jgi:DNA-binding LacI/PurR family transcriptional regulator
VRATCARRGLPDPVVVETPVDSADAGHMARALTTQGVSGICAFDDLSGLAFLSGAHVAGVRVPEDLAVVGVDDSSTARLTEPPLTSVLHDFADIAEFIAEGVISRLRGSEPPPDPAPRAIRITARASTLGRATSRLGAE